MRNPEIEKRQQEQKSLILNQFKKTPIVQISCEKIGISRATYYRWRKEDKDFFKEADQALSEGRSLMNDMAESQLLSAIRDKNLTAIIFWLKNNHNRYRNKIELSGEVKTKDEPLTEEQSKLIQEALTLASLNDLPSNLKKHE